MTDDAQRQDRADVPGYSRETGERLPVPPAQRSPALWWITEAATQFANGCLSGVPAGVGVGGVAAGGMATTQAAPLDTLAAAGVGGVFTSATMIGHGLRAFLIWHHSHPITNWVFPPMPRNP